jgi:hypothetical protein
VGGLSVYAKRNPEQLDVRIDQVHRQLWSQQLAAAAARFGMDVDAVLRLCPSELVQLQAVDAGGVSLALPHPEKSVVHVVTHANQVLALGFVVGALQRPVHLRWVLARVPAGRACVEGKNCWSLPTGTSCVGALYSWTDAFKSGCYVALKQLGNQRRQALVRQYLQEQIVRGSGGHKKWARLVAYSFEQPYWRVFDVLAARRLLRLRLDLGPYEDNVRRRPFGKTESYPALSRVHDPLLRVCYACYPPVPGHPHFGVASVKDRSQAVVAPKKKKSDSVVVATGPVSAAGGLVYCHETLEHVALVCVCPAMVTLRVNARAWLSELASQQSTIDVAMAEHAVAPDFNDDTSLLVALLLGTAVGPVAAAPAHPQFVEGIGRSVSSWVRALTDDWVSRLRAPHLAGVASSSPGGRLAAYAAAWALNVFQCHRQVLRHRNDYHARLRDTRAAPVAADVPGPSPISSVGNH